MGQVSPSRAVQPDRAARGVSRPVIAPTVSSCFGVRYALGAAGYDENSSSKQPPSVRTGPCMKPGSRHA